MRESQLNQIKLETALEDIQITLETNIQTNFYMSNNLAI